MTDLETKHRKALDSAAGIPTWTTGEELAWLAEQSLTRRNILEIGTHRGASAKVIACAMPDDCRLTCFDLCNDAGVEMQAISNLVEEITTKRVTYIQQHAGVSAVRYWSRHAPFDMIWIDDGHTYSDVVRDCLSACLLKEAGALVCGHDCERHPTGAPCGEVANALSDCFGWENVKQGPGSIWYL
jgi:predicted O-methyltransferase YrrM